jgi:hypothetical protein
MTATLTNVGDVIPANNVLKRIHVNQNLLRKAIAGEDVCPYIIRYKGRTYPAKTFEVEGIILGINRVHKPLSCGARLFLETKGRITFYSY